MRALPSVAWRSTSCASGAPGSGSLTAANRQNIFIAWNTLCTSVPLQLSQPSPSRTPASRRSQTGAMPLLSFMLLRWLSTMPASAAAIRSISVARDPDAVHDVEPRVEEAVSSR